MMSQRELLRLALALGVVACEPSEPRVRSATASAPTRVSAEPAVHTFRVDSIDFVYFEEEGGGSAFAVLWRDDVVLDTVDFNFGVPAIGPDTLVYVPIRQIHFDGDMKVGHRFPLTLFARGEHTDLASLLPEFGPFSSPSVIRGSIYYWTLRADSASGRHELWARRFDLRTSTGDSLFVGRAVLPATDDESLLPSPFVEGDSVTFVYASLSRRLPLQRPP